MFPTKDDQITGYEHQKKSDNCQINICLHKLLPPLHHEINSKNKQATDNSGKKNRVRNIPFYHDFTPSTSFSEDTTKIKVIISEATRFNKRSETSLEGRVNNGEIIPAANQATAILPKISANFFNCPEVNFPIARNDTTAPQGLRPVKVFYF